MTLLHNCIVVLSSIVGCGKVAEFYIGFFKGSSFYDPSLILLTTESQPVYYSVEAPGVGYYDNGTILANDRVMLLLTFLRM